MLLSQFERYTYENEDGDRLLSSNDMIVNRFEIDEGFLKISPSHSTKSLRSANEPYKIVDMQNPEKITFAKILPDKLSDRRGDHIYLNDCLLAVPLKDGK